MICFDPLRQQALHSLMLSGRRGSDVNNLYAGGHVHNHAGIRPRHEHMCAQVVCAHGHDGPAAVLTPQLSAGPPISNFDLCV